MGGLGKSIMIYEKTNCHQPPPNLPRRGGTDTIGYLIIICKHLIICDLSANRVTCISPSGENERGLMAIG